ncbi:MAG: RNA polymerase sigma factor [Candidatus Binataceae bacterium]
MAKPRRAHHAHTSDRFYSPRQLDDQTEELQALLDEAKAGSRQAEGELLVRYRDRMVLYCAARLSGALRQKVDEDDLAQTASAHAWRGFDRFHGREPERYWAWLRQICHLRLYGEAKRDLSREELLDELLLEDGSQHPYRRRERSGEAIMEARETAEQLQAAIGKLPELQREIVVWHIADGLAFAEIARRLTRSNDFVERSFQRAAQRLKHLLPAWAHA